ncbi:hypothetical protein CTI12_AA042900 [Artemisia annua]|uniref:Uncharacterized protein n=1 Tax=Artemisia annua TaxID=35608 RepID=A0A2U1QDJ1_ARTAN|nr:hypothetical protein CTI12_AA042900 [Artemisia annua]
MESHSLSRIKMARTCPIISHIFFADESLFFLKASQAECWTLIRLFNLYCHASAQSVNFDKSSAFFSPNTLSLLCKDICDALQVQQMDSKDKYLGLPSVYGKHKGELFDFLLEKVLLKMQGWKQKLLSQAGSEILIKSVIQAIPSFSGVVILMNVIYTGKVGFRDLEEFNTALLAKQGWRLLMNPTALWGKVLKGLYFPNCGFLVAKKGSHLSWLWSSVLHGRDLFLQGVRWQVGNVHGRCTDLIILHRLATHLPIFLIDLRTHLLFVKHENKKKPVPNKTAKEIPIDVSQYLGFPGSHSHQVSASTSIGHSGTIDVGQHSTIPVFCPLISASVENNLHRTATFCDIAGASSSRDEAATGSGMNSSGFGIVNSPHNVHFSDEQLLVNALPHRADLPAGVPTQVRTVDGLLSNFQTANIVRPSSVAIRRRTIGEDLTNAGNLGRVPMVLDFSSGDVVLDPNSAASNTRRGAHQRRILARLRRPRGYKHFFTAALSRVQGPSSMGDADGPPVQGPVAPPQREGKI